MGFVKSVWLWATSLVSRGSFHFPIQPIRLFTYIFNNPCFLGLVLIFLFGSFVRRLSPSTLVFSCPHLPQDNVRVRTFSSIQFRGNLSTDLFPSPSIYFMVKPFGFFFLKPSNRDRVPTLFKVPLWLRKGD